MISLPLAGYKIIDLSTSIAGCATSRILCDWGADVIKIEGPYTAPSRLPSGILDSLSPEAQANTFDSLYSGKRNVWIDAAHPNGRAVLQKLFERADVAIFTDTEKKLKKDGFNYECLSLKYPSLVWAQITAFGENGPMAEIGDADDMLSYWARSGFMIDVTEKGTPPLVPAPGFGEMQAATSLAGGICAALYGRIRTGRGERVSMSLYGQAMWALSSLVQSTQYGMDVYPKHRKANFPFNNSFRCRDGKWIYLTLFDANRWAKLAKVLNREVLITNDKFNNRTAMMQNREEVIGVMDRAFLERDRDEWVEIFKSADIPFSKIKNVIDMKDDEQARKNNFIYDVQFRGRKIPRSATPVQFGTPDPPAYRPAPRLGEHTNAVLADLGFSENEINQLRQETAVR